MIFKGENWLNFTKPISVCFVGVVFFFVCSTGPQQAIDESYIRDIKKWHQTRLERLKNKDGWLSLAGLYWLEPGENSFGSDKENDFMVSSKSAAGIIGKFILTQEGVRFKTQKGIPVTFKNQHVTEILLKDDSHREPTILKLETLSWYVIKRGDKLGVRLKDSGHPRLQKLKKIETFPIDSAWRVEAKLEKFDAPQNIDIPTILGTTEKQSSPGILIFKINEKSYQLYPLGGDGNLFIIFGDKTNGNETYGGGRFLAVKKPDSNGQTVIDFNKAYNPPCVFSQFATCPLPPDENLLSIRVMAGEKMVKGFTH